MRRRSLLAGLALAPAAARAQRGDTVFWNAWGGDPRTNDFITWVDARMQVLHGIAVRHVKLTDTAEAVARVLAEQKAGRVEGGSVDLIWINGPNFLAMKQQKLLLGPVLDVLPNARLLDKRLDGITRIDFTVPTGGYEVPWRLARIVLIHSLAAPPRSMAELLSWSSTNLGRFTHPTARNFLGATFLKQALIELAADKPALLLPAANVEAVTAPLWDWYRALRPALWRGGRAFPETDAAQQTLMNDGEIDLMISFDPATAAIGARDGTLPKTARATGFAGGSIANCSFVAIPFNAAHKEAALLLANFLLSPDAQAHAADPGSLAVPPLLDLDRLEPADRARFSALPQLPGLPSAAELGPALPEPHPSWMTAVTAAWERLVTA